MATVVVGATFFVIVGFAAYKSRQSIKSNSCPGCGGSCSIEDKKKCGKS
jgi:anaerobic selenocysteine-containing dehydrogenase